MKPDDIRTLFRYHRWAWDRVLAQTARVNTEQYLALAPVPHGSLRGTLVHALSAEITWQRRLQGESPTELLQEVSLPIFADLQVRWQVETDALQQAVEALTDTNLSATLHYKNTHGTPMENVLWHLLMHVVNHGTQHRAEAAMLLTTFGFSPDDLDLITFLLEDG